MPRRAPASQVGDKGVLFGFGVLGKVLARLLHAQIPLKIVLVWVWTALYNMGMLANSEKLHDWHDLTLK